MTISAEQWAAAVARNAALADGAPGTARDRRRLHCDACGVVAGLRYARVGRRGVYLCPDHHPDTRPAEEGADGQ
ncbi:MAG TPA: hypothetical protein VF041_23350 [Gemmatimonadaceae bacterium]